MRKIKMLSLTLVCVLLTGCGIFPKEEELSRTPIIKAYQQEEFKMVEVKKGTLSLYEKIDAVCMNYGETRYKFDISNLPYQGVYVKQGEKVSKGTKLAEITAAYNDTQVASPDQLVLTAKEDSTITYVTEIEDGEKSVAGHNVVIANSSDAFYLNAYTKYWEKFKFGDTVQIHIAGEDYPATVIDPLEIGQEISDAGEDGVGQIFLKVEFNDVYLKSEDVGTVTILVEEKKDVLYIPQSALTNINDKDVVYVENKDGIRSAKYVETGLHADNKVEITKGLSLGDKVILDRR